MHAYLQRKYENFYLIWLDYRILIKIYNILVEIRRKYGWKNNEINKFNHENNTQNHIVRRYARIYNWTHEKNNRDNEIHTEEGHENKHFCKRVT